MPPYRIDWLDEARADVRALDQTTAMHLFDGILRFARTGSGDVNAAASFECVDDGARRMED